MVIAVAAATAITAGGWAQGPQLKIAATVGWELTGNSENPSVSIGGNLPPSTTRAVVVYGVAGQAPQTTAARLDFSGGLSRAYIKTELRYGVHYRAQLTAETPAGALNSREIGILPEPRVLRPSPYLRYGRARARGGLRTRQLQDVQLVGARGWRAWNCAATRRLSVRD